MAGLLCKLHIVSRDTIKVHLMALSPRRVLVGHYVHVVVVVEGSNDDNVEEGGGG